MFDYVDFTGEENELEFLEKCYEQWQIIANADVPEIRKIMGLGTIFSGISHRIEEIK